MSKPKPLPGWTRIHEEQVIFRSDLSYFDRVVYAALTTYLHDDDPDTHRPAVVLAEVAKRLNTSRPRVSNAVRRLKAKGLVESDPADPARFVLPLFEGRDVAVPPVVRGAYRPQYEARTAGGTPHAGAFLAFPDVETTADRESFALSGEEPPGGPPPLLLGFDIKTALRPTAPAVPAEAVIPNAFEEVEW